MSIDEEKYRSFFEELLDEIHGLGYNITQDIDQDSERIVVFEKYQLIITVIKKELNIDFDIYADLKSGIYEIGDIHLLNRKMLEVKQVCLSFNAREMNTTERLYPLDRQGKQTQTSGL